MVNKVNINLSIEEIKKGGEAGLVRQITAINNNSEHTYKQEKSWGDWGNNIEGALGELAVATYLGIDWDSEANRKGMPDVGQYEVRTHPLYKYKMVIRSSDKDRSIFVLVTGQLGEYVLHGWILAKDAKKKEYLWQPDPKRPASYFVPQNKLHDMKELKNGKK